MTDTHFPSAVAFIEQELAAGTFPGATLAVMQHGTLLAQHHWGTYCSRTRRDNPLGPSTVHMLFSFSKGITATVAAILLGEGHLDLDRPVVHYIPEFRGGLRDRILVRHLFSHAAGIPSVNLVAAHTGEGWRDAVRLCLDATVEWEPGAKTHYHGHSAQLLAGEIMRRVCHGETLDSICRQKLFEPLGATSLTFNVPEGEHIALTPQPAELPCPIDGAHFGLLGHPGGGCFGTPTDMLKVLQLNLQDGAWNGKQLIEPRAFREMHTIQFAGEINAAHARGEAPVHEPYGLGWLIRGHLDQHWFGLGTRTGVKTFGHAGIDTVIGVADPDQDLAIAFLTTGSPNPSGDNTVRIRNTVTDLVVQDLTNAARLA